MVTERKGDWIQTYTGRAFWPADPRASEVSIQDIAHSLSKICRFGGHCKWFYSVAQHSVLVSQVVPPKHALAGLLHDATEAYVADMPRPVKRMLGAAYADMEQRVWEAICERFQLPIELPASVKLADNTMLLAERAVLLGPTPDVPGAWGWAKGLEPADVEIQSITTYDARKLFLERFTELM